MLAYQGNGSYMTNVKRPTPVWPQTVDTTGCGVTRSLKYHYSQEPDQTLPKHPSMVDQINNDIRQLNTAQWWKWINHTGSYQYNIEQKKADTKEFVLWIVLPRSSNLNKDKGRRGWRPPGVSWVVHILFPGLSDGYESVFCSWVFFKSIFMF